MNAGGYIALGAIGGALGALIVTFVVLRRPIILSVSPIVQSELRKLENDNNVTELAQVLVGNDAFVHAAGEAAARVLDANLPGPRVYNGN